MVIDFITLGCSKNLVDSEKLTRQLVEAGHTVFHDRAKLTGEVVIINTCGFIGDAKEQSINAILAAADRKTKGWVKRLYVMGCLSQRYKKELKKEIPEVDKFYGKFDMAKIVKDLGGRYKRSISYERCLATPKYYAYLKIAEGCNRTCSYCAIPLITGSYKSRTIEDIKREVEYLVSIGVREFQVLAQDLTYYGRDIYGEPKIAELVNTIAKVKGVKWLRLHYAYPTQFPYDLLDAIRDNANVCKYLDIALQHISDNMLSKMRRGIDKAGTYKLINTIRERVPGICIRTTFMVGHPGETEDDFRELCDFVRNAKFERMGAFKYSEEDGTYAALNYADDIPDDVKQHRLDTLMQIQQDVQMELNAAMVGKVYKVIIDRLEGDYYVGRTEYDSPDVDLEVLIPVSGGKLKCGCFYNVKITDYEEFDLYGVAVI
ncbi:MAG: 30S ribosomal protein S12 methylthiotransferase RimO [Paludibacteraceae bacterium]|nr:30S ribosomal protein S12 methylthiotransferase RimO [Paludibacteraceae bacterium]